MKEDTESRIGRSLRAVAENDNGETRAKLYDALQRQRLILPLGRTPKQFEASVDSRVTNLPELEFLASKTNEGLILELFTSPQQLTEWKRDVPTWIAIDTPSLCRIALQHRISRLRINSGSQFTVQLSHSEIMNLAARDAGAPR